MIGPDWKWGDQDGGKSYIGAVYRLKKPTEVYVSTIISRVTPKNKYYQWQDDYQRKRKLHFTKYSVL